MLFLASDLLRWRAVPPVLDPDFVGGFAGGLTSAGFAVGPPVAAVRCACGGFSPGISPPDIGWHAPSATLPISSPEASSTLEVRYGESGTGESIG
jgi:hypothetical protein